MNRRIKSFFTLALAWLVCAGGVGADQFVLTSKDLGPGLTRMQVFSGFGCNGENISPSLSWSNAPDGTKSFAVTVYDPDAPKAGGWWHWLIFNIPANVSGLAAGAGNPGNGLAPGGSIQSLNDFGSRGFGGACPPKGDRPHRYIFTVYALDVPSLGLDQNALPSEVKHMIDSHTLAKASIVSIYGRQ
ncbi:MAG: phosphatidylethanolamine-binding protein [Deltaproteobacteria bacterium]|nr:MAG: phosphatidylethanolamine-binding protein [Deltaproteobacteria bacterium]